MLWLFDPSATFYFLIGAHCSLLDWLIDWREESLTNILLSHIVTLHNTTLHIVTFITWKDITVWNWLPSQHVIVNNIKWLWSKYKWRLWQKDDIIIKWWQKDEKQAMAGPGRDGGGLSRRDDRFDNLHHQFYLSRV